MVILGKPVAKRVDDSTDFADGKEKIDKLRAVGDADGNLIPGLEAHRRESIGSLVDCLQHLGIGNFVPLIRKCCADMGGTECKLVI